MLSFTAELFINSKLLEYLEVLQILLQGSWSCKYERFEQAINKQVLPDIQEFYKTDDGKTENFYWSVKNIYALWLV